MQMTRDLILRLFEEDRLTAEQVMTAIRAKLITDEDAKEILGDEYIETVIEFPELITDAIEERFKLMETTVVNELRENIKMANQLVFPDVIKGGRF